MTDHYCEITFSGLRVWKEDLKKNTLYFHCATNIATPKTRTPLTGVIKLTIFGAFLGNYYLVFLNLFLKVERILKEMMHFTMCEIHIWPRPSEPTGMGVVKFISLVNPLLFIITVSGVCISSPRKRVDFEKNNAFSRYEQYSHTLAQ